MGLPFKKQDHSRKSMDDVSMLLLGKSKSGKTTFSNAMGDAAGKPVANIMTENGLTMEADSLRIRSWTKLIELLDMLELPKNKEELVNTYSRISLDLCSDLDSYCAQYVCKKEGKDHLSEIGSIGKGYHLAELEFEKQMDRVLGLGLPVNFILHIKETIITDGEGKNSLLSEPSVQKFAGKFIGAKADVIAVIGTTAKGESKLSIQPSFNGVAGSRVPEIVGVYDLDHSDMGNTIKEINSNFKGATNV